MSNRLPFKRPQVRNKSGWKWSAAAMQNRTGAITVAVMAARTVKQIQEQTPVLRDWYQFIAESKKRVP